MRYASIILGLALLVAPMGREARGALVPTVDPAAPTVSDSVELNVFAGNFWPVLGPIVNSSAVISGSDIFWTINGSSPVIIQPAFDDLDESELVGLLPVGNYTVSLEVFFDGNLLDSGSTSFTVSAVPEPGSVALMGVILVLAAWRRLA